jgi:hypothetical protein
MKYNQKASDDLTKVLNSGSLVATTDRWPPNPEPKTPFPKLEILDQVLSEGVPRHPPNPGSWTPNPQPSAINPKLSNLNPQPSTLDPQP